MTSSLMTSQHRNDLADVPPTERKVPSPCREMAAPLPGRGDAAMKSLRKNGRTALAVL